MKNLFILFLLFMLTKSVYNVQHLKYSSNNVVYRHIPFYGAFYKLLGYEVYEYSCIDIIYINKKEIRNTSGYLGLCNISKINKNIEVLENEEKFIP